MELEHLVYEKRGHIAVATLNRPEANNWTTPKVQQYKKRLAQAG